MAKKKKSWFYLLKRLFVSETNSTLETERRIRRRCAFGFLTNGFLTKRRLASLSAAPLPPENEHRRDATSEGATAPAASSDEQLLANNFDNQVKEANDQQVLANYADHDHIPECDTYVKDIQVLAAIKIQTAFRAYIARKALRALKGLVRLQAIFRGRAVRRQAISTLKCLQTIVNIQSQVCAKRCEIMLKNITSQENNKLVHQTDNDKDLRSQRRWDDSPLSKEEANAIGMSKREAEIKRERIKEYWSAHRRSAESDQRRVTSRRRYLIEQWVDAQLAKREDYNKMDAMTSIKPRFRDQIGGRQLKSQKEYQSEGLNSPIYIPRRSFHRKQHSIGDESCCTESVAVPTYMAATESAKAKTRSLSSPRLRPIDVDCDAYSEIYSPYKHRLSPISSIYSEATGITRRIVNPIGLSQWSPCLKSLPGPIKSTTSVKDLSLNSDVSIPTWAPYGSYRLYTRCD